LSDSETNPTPDLEAFRAEVRSFLAESFDDELQALAARQAGVFAYGELARRWHAILYAKGWAAPSWPREYGGPGWTWEQRQIYQTECERVGTPRIPAFGITLCAPVIMRYGSDAQKAFLLPRILSGEFYFCQGYSEPQSGSDLASLQTRAVRDGDDYVVNGTKIWTTHAHFANWIFMLVRTSTEGRPQAGISFLVSPLDVPGISIRPILSMSGEHEINQVFFDNVRVPVANRFGAENEGWSVAKYLLEHERGSGDIGVSLQVAVEHAKSVAAREFGDDGRRLIDDPDVRRRIALHELDARVGSALDKRISAALSSGQSVGAAGASIKKLMGSECGQQIAELTMQALGVYAAVDQRPSLGEGLADPFGPDYAMTPTAKFLNGRATTIFGGSSEVQRNILAKSILGL
jgi:alkylation response protein AidB-like acyl-CoA dehydrogenase